MFKRNLFHSKIYLWVFSYETKPALLSSCAFCLWKTGQGLSPSLLYHGDSPSSSLRVNYFIRAVTEREKNVDIVRALEWRKNWRENIQNWSRDRRRCVPSRCANHGYLQIIGDQIRQEQPTFSHFLWYPWKKLKLGKMPFWGFQGQKW